MVHGIRLVGVVERFHGDRNELVWRRVGRIRAKDRIEVWLRLLALTAARGCPLTAYLFGSKNGDTSTLAGPPPEDARELLGDWVAVWKEGQRRPLPFFADASWTWTGKQSSTAVVATWAGQPWSEGYDPVHRMMFPDGPVNESFADLAGRLLGPLRRATS